MDLIQFNRSLKGAANSVMGLLEAARCTFPDRAKLPREVIEVLVADDLAADLLFRDIDLVIAGAVWLRAEIAERQAGAKG